ncbi:MAG: hypothetical protein Q9162_000747 [Coniocarpon cinnabarinum]
MWFAITGQKPKAIPIVGEHAIRPGGLMGLAIDTLQSSRPDFRRLFHLLADESKYPIHLYCQQGKDRTGLAVILLLLLLEVPVEVIKDDYMRSQEMLEVIEVETEEEFRRKGLPREFALCDPNLVQWVVDWLWFNYKGVGGYLTSIGVHEKEQARIRQILRPTISCSRAAGQSEEDISASESSLARSCSDATVDDSKSSVASSSTMSKDSLVADMTRENATMVVANTESSD